MDAGGTARRADVMNSLTKPWGLTPKLEDVLTPPKGGRDCYAPCERLPLAVAADLAVSKPVSKCPLWLPYASPLGGKLCFTDANDAKRGITSGVDCSNWCTLDPEVGSGCGDNREQLCNRWTCPDSFPHQSDVLGGMNCFRGALPPGQHEKWLIAHNNVSMCFSHDWCTLRPSSPQHCTHLYMKACAVPTTTTSTRLDDERTATTKAASVASDSRDCRKPCRDILALACHPGLPNGKLALPTDLSAFKYRNQIKTLIKSIVLSQITNFSNMLFHWTIWIMVDQGSEAALKSEISQMQDVAMGIHSGPSVNIKFLQIQSLQEKYGEALHVTGRCATAHMFMHELLPSYVDEVLMLHPDQVVVQDLAQLWDNAKDMGWDDSKLFGATEECVEQRNKCGWYSITPKHRFFQNGLRVGTVLFSVKNMRELRFSAWFLTAISRFVELKHADQDILNEYAKENPQNVILLQCNFNVHPDTGCDMKKTSPVVLQGIHDEFLRVQEWAAIVIRIDGMFDLLKTGGPDALPKARSIWDALDTNETSIKMKFLGAFHRPWGLTPRLDQALRPPKGSRNCYEICQRPSLDAAGNLSLKKPLAKCPDRFPHLSAFGGKLCFSTPGDAKGGLALDCSRWCTLDPEYGTGLCGDNREQLCNRWECPQEFPYKNTMMGGTDCFKSQHPPGQPEPCFRKDWCTLEQRIPSRCEHLYLKACKPSEL
eukprot:TRINITY_DN26204_c0_g2_i1.p1 TRINITY_DN26204_c0_g2~~TRINITY_DN26204_c0_g2_i1.p1  ORF type:complete len:730 (-),score=103.14 TRINITY_DN26204_c0_g2_i1:24-2150(-)